MKYFGWIFLFFIMLYILPLNNRPILSDTEIRHRETTCEMFAGDAILPVYGGEVQFHKMPMANWLTIGSYKLFGINRFSNRLPGALAIGITALLVALMIQQTMRDEKLAALSATVCLSFSLALFLSNSDQTMAVFTMFVSGASGALFLATQEQKINRRKFFMIIVSGLFTAAAFLTAGSYAFLFPAAAVILFVISESRIKELFFIAPFYLFFSLLPIVPWAITVESVYPGYWQEFVSFSNFTATLGTAANWYAYPAVLLIGFFPVIILLPTVIMAGRESWSRLMRQPLCRFALIAMITAAVAVTALRNAPLGMIFAVFPALSLLISMGIQAYFNNGGHHRSFNWMLNVWGLFLVISGIIEVICWYMSDNILAGYAETLPITRLFLINLGITSLLGGGILLYSLRGNWRSRLYLYFFSIAILPLAISWCFNSEAKIQDPNLRRIFCNENQTEVVKSE